MSISMFLKDLTPTVRRARRLGEKQERAVLAAIRSEGELIMTESQRQVPVSKRGSDGRPPGFLKNSRFVEVDPRTGQVVLGYRAFYAIFVHEAPPTTNFRVGKRKYLSDPIRQASRGYAGRVAARARRIMEAA